MTAAVTLPAEPDPGFGHNNPPPDLLGRLCEDHADLLKRRDELLGGIGRAPKEIEDEDTAGRMADFVQKQIDPFLKRAKDVHQAEKEPFLSGGRTVDGFWHTLIDDIEKGKAALNVVRKAYADKKAAEERRRREEEARKAAEVARLAREKAAEEERKRIAAEMEAARLRDEAAEARRKQEAAEAASLQSESDLAAALEREARRKRDDEAAEAARIAGEKAAAEAARIAADEAERAEKSAAEAAKAAAAKPAELGRSRGGYGGMTTLKQFYDFKDVDRANIDLEALRWNLSDDSINKAIRAWIDANKEAVKAGRQLAGVTIFENTRL